MTDGDAHTEALLDALTLEELVALLAGADFWTTTPVERLGIPSIRVTDGPSGARGGGALVGGTRTASFPAGIALAATWDIDRIRQIGQALAEETRAKGARVLLGPTVNMHRSPLNGRNFECYSEDPLLSAEIVCAYIEGLQSHGVAACIKHYAGNESEFERMTISSEIDERTLREIYLPPFEAAVKRAGVWSVMAAYNRLNGILATEHTWLLHDVLRTEWGFDGVTISDWFAARSTTAAAEAGLDLEMPGPTRFRGPALVDAVRAGTVSTTTVRDAGRRVLRLVQRVGAFDASATDAEQEIDRADHRALIRRAGAEGIVLLKNDGLLPLDPTTPRTIAVIGPNAATAQIMGGGSAQVNAYYRVSPLEGISARAHPGLQVRYAHGCTNHRLLPVLQRSVDIACFDNPDLRDNPVVHERRTETEVMWLDRLPDGITGEAFSARMSLQFEPEYSGEHEFSLVSAGLSRLLVDGTLLIDNWSDWQPGDNYFGAASAERIASLELVKGRSYALDVEYGHPARGLFGMKVVRLGVLRPLGDDAIEQAVALAAECDVAVVCAGLTGEWDTEGRDRPDMDLVGRQDELIARVAAANPKTVVVLQTGGPVTMPWLAEVAAVLEAWYPGQECGNSIADVLFGDVNPSGRLPQTFPVRLEDNPAFGNYPGENGRVTYAEGVFVGYRHYRSRGITPLFAFGHGLSYTTFDYANLSVSTPVDGAFTVSVEVTNTGARAGQEVVQVYVSDRAARVPRPAFELKAFAKTVLQPGETRALRFALDRRALAYYSVERGDWFAEAGDFTISVGGSSQDIRASEILRVRFQESG